MGRPDQGSRTEQRSDPAPQPTNQPTIQVGPARPPTKLHLPLSLSSLSSSSTPRAPWVSRGPEHVCCSRSVLLCCAVLCCAVLCCAVLCCAVLCCAVLRCCDAALRCTALHFTSLGRSASWLLLLSRPRLLGSQLRRPSRAVERPARLWRRVPCLQGGGHALVLARLILLEGFGEQAAPAQTARWSTRPRGLSPE